MSIEISKNVSNDGFENTPRARTHYITGKILLVDGGRKDFL